MGDDRVEFIRQQERCRKIQEHIMSDTKTTDTTSKIDDAIKAAKARQATKAAANGEAPATSDGTSAAPAAKPVKATDEQKAAQKAAKDAERAAAKVIRDVERAEKKAAKEAAKATKTPHMSKVDKAAEKLPSLSKAAQSAFDDLTTNLTATDISGLAAHLTHFNRVKATGRALDAKLNVGDTVRIVSGDSRYLGAEGTVVKAQRIRCYVSVEGASKDVYLYNSDVELVRAVVPAATGTEG